MDKSVRITGGEYRGQKIATPGDGTHPMGERERLALFNMLTSQIAGASVLDLYAGGGTLGLEAISRGAEKVIFVEKNHKAASILRENIAKLGADELCTVVTEDVRTYISTTNQEFDIVFADPPYDKYENAFTSDLAGIVGGDGILVLSHPGDAPLLPGLSLLKTRQYAGAHLSFYQKDV